MAISRVMPAGSEPEVGAIEPVVGDSVLVCVDCGGGFLFTAGERAFYDSKCLSVPKRCPECRATRRRTLVKEVRHGQST
jgi:hypothetical protein